MIDLNGILVPDHFNGVGWHDSPGSNCGPQTPQEAAEHAQLLRAHGVTTYKLLTENGSGDLHRAIEYTKAGIVVIPRWYVDKPWGRGNYRWVTPGDQMKPFFNAGVRVFEPGWNEFNISGEWPEGHYPNDPAAIAVEVVNAWEEGLKREVEIPGAVMLFPSNTPGGNTDHRACYLAIKAELIRRGLLGTVRHMAIHPRPHNNPPDTPWTATNTCTFNEYDWIRRQFPDTVFYWATEHGYSVKDDQNHDFPPIDLAKWLEYNWELFMRLNPAHLKAIHPQLAGVHYWIEALWGHRVCWEKDSLRDAFVPEMPTPSPLYLRMEDPAYRPLLDFSRYSTVPQPPAVKPKGFDVSQAQVNINWAAGVTAGNEFAMIRFSTGLTLDPGAFARHMPGSEGKRYIRFGYHAFKASVSAEYQARLLLGLCHEFPVSGAILDAEALGGAITPAMLRKFADTWDSLTSIPFIFYSSPSFIATLTSRGDISFLAKYPLWIAHWGVDAPTVPAPWTTWTFWQTGKVLGPEYYLPIDRDLYNGTSAQLWAQFGFIPAWCGDGTEPPQPPTELVIKDRAGTVKDWAWLTAEFGLTPANVMQGTGWRVTQLQEGGPAASLLVYGPPGTQVIWGWPDGRITETIEPKGYRGFDMGPGAYYFPPNTGPHYIEVGDCKITGLGMLGGTEHRHIDITIAPA